MGILIGPPIGGLLPPIIASYTAVSCVGATLLYVIFVLDESLSERSKQEVSLKPINTSCVMFLPAVQKLPAVHAGLWCCMFSACIRQGAWSEKSLFMNLKEHSPCMDLFSIHTQGTLCFVLCALQWCTFFFFFTGH